MTQTSLFSTAPKVNAAARKVAPAAAKPAAPKVAERDAERDEEIARTILEQLGGTGRLVAMTGAKHFMTDGPAVSFKFANRAPAPNYVKITLDASDTYTVTFGRIVKFELRSSSTVSGIYCDQLVELFENTTGLYLSL